MAVRVLAHLLQRSNQLTLQDSGPAPPKHKVHSLLNIKTPLVASTMLICTSQGRVRGIH